MGLTNALKLKQLNKDYDITVVATHMPGDLSIQYTSPFAGANWMSFASPDNKEWQEFDTEAYHQLMKLADEPRSGIWLKKNYMYYSPQFLDSVNGDISKAMPWFAKLTNATEIPKAELLADTKFGLAYDGLVISVPIYLAYLVQCCLEIGIVFKRVTAITDIEHARHLHSSGAPARLVINSAGLYASKMKGVTDIEKNYPIRGQVVLVRNKIPAPVLVRGSEIENEELYAFPRKEGGTVIGGCFLKNDSSEAEDKELTKRILNRALKYLPELIDTKLGNPNFIDIVRVNVGHRPGRDLGPRIEKDGSKKWLIHSYGAGGGGYQGSYGYAKKVVELANEALVAAKL